MDAIITQYSVVGIVAIMMMREFLKHLREKDKVNPLKDIKYDRLQKQVDDLHGWHEITDHSTGMKVWYTQTISNEIRELRKEIKDVHHDLHELLKQVTINNTAINKLSKD